MKRISLVLAACALLAGCGTAGGATSSAPTVTIKGPGDGADVASSFALEFTSSEEIGPTSSGKDHVHVFTDGHTSDYTVVTASPFQVKGLPPGKHTVGVTLQHADHSPAGASAQISVNVTGGGAPAGPSQSDDKGGYGGY